MRLERENEGISIDWVSCLLYLALVAYGWVCIYSASSNPENPEFVMASNYGKQLIWTGVSFVTILVIFLLDPKIFQVGAYPVYGLFILLLALVPLIGVEVNGNKSWLDFGFFRFQPAEFTKFATALALAKFFSSYGVSWEKRSYQLMAIGLILFPMGLVVLQGDAGSALVFTSLVLVLYREGMSGWILFIGLALVATFVITLLTTPMALTIFFSLVLLLLMAFNYRNLKGLLFSFFFLGGLIVFTHSSNFLFYEVLKPHQRIRIEILLGLKEDPRNAGYNVEQSQIAIGSGGFSGKGFLQGTQTKGDFIPEQHTDFIFCTIGEEFGWLGTTAVLILFCALLLRLIYIAERQRNTFSRVYGYAVVAILFFHLMVNIGMTINLMPVIGIPLPFFSYGGSSLLAFSILLFIFLKMDSNRKNEFASSYSSY